MGLVVVVTSVVLPSICSMGLVLVKEACEVPGWRMEEKDGVLLDRSVEETSAEELGKDKVVGRRSLGSMKLILPRTGVHGVEIVDDEEKGLGWGGDRID